jgi:hypothetical protein
MSPPEREFERLDATRVLVQEKAEIGGGRGGAGDGQKHGTLVDGRYVDATARPGSIVSVPDAIISIP